MTIDLIDRAQGCLLGQLAGDALGGLVEFRTADDIRKEYPNGVRELVDGGHWGTVAGQPTDDSEMALMLARMLVEKKHYDPARARESYLYWLNSGPYDCGSTISSSLRGGPRPESEANGALMRISPLGIFGANYDLGCVAEWARLDAAITHPNPVCVEANAIFTMTIAHAVNSGGSPEVLYQAVLGWAQERGITGSLLDTIQQAADRPPADYITKMGWVLIALQNAFWQLLHAPDLTEAVVDTVMRGGDTDTNAAICGALLGAVHGRKAVPAQWEERLLQCRPEAGRPGVKHPRPKCFWPIDALELAENLLRP